MGAEPEDFIEHDAEARGDEMLADQLDEALRLITEIADHIGEPLPPADG